MVLSLGVITIIAAALLSGVYTVTKAPIEEANMNKQVEAISAVTPEFNNDPVAEAVEITPAGEALALMVFPARNDGELVGAAVESYTNNGFSGFIKVIYGFDAKGTVTGFAVMEHAETPGLGAKMDDWFRDSAGNRSVIGRATDTDLIVAKDGGDVDAITAATITSRAFLDALNRAAKAYRQYSAE
ncbi:MAG: RnfABCDGE type electron transport complex subunit G [Duncaniella sp.]|nr:RnfABCDGE type electron transport complex subunit G [Duncaniella sp.]